MFDYNKYKRMIDIEDTMRGIMFNFYALAYYNYTDEESVNLLSNKMLHLNRLMVAYNKYENDDDIKNVFGHYNINSLFCNVKSMIEPALYHKLKAALRVFFDYVNNELYRDMGLYLSNNQEENNHLNNELREEYRCVINELLNKI